MRNRFFQAIAVLVLVHVIFVNFARASNCRDDMSAGLNNRSFDRAACPQSEAVVLVTVAGRVFNSAGMPLRSIRVVLIDTLHGAATVDTYTGSLGWFAFTGVESGRVYQLGIVSSRYQAFFQPVQPSGDVFNMDIITFQ